MLHEAPKFTFEKTTIRNHITNHPYILRRMVDIVPSDVFLDSIVRVCNEPHIYNWLFRARLQGKPYPRKDAEWFHNWGMEGWNSKQHFKIPIRPSRKSA